MKKYKDFIINYPVPLPDAVLYPFIYKIWNKMEDIPDIKLKCIIDFCQYAGYSEGAVRTTISRMKKKGILISTGDKQKAGYKVSDLFRMRTMQIKDDAVAKGFTLATFSFNRENEKERYIIRSVLTKTGFKKLAQNTYINTRGRRKELLQKIQNERLEKHIYIFECEEDLDENTIQRLTEIWKVKDRLKSLNRFYSDLQKFIKPEGLPEEEIFHMLGYAGSVYFSIFQRNEPPIPEKYLPTDYSIKKIFNFLSEKNNEYFSKTKKYFIRSNE